ncbi:MAG: tetratricopeptide repeat protein [Prolixibacteraceae bacterium]
MPQPINHIIHQFRFDKGQPAKTIFVNAAMLLLLFMLFNSKQAGISGDEEVHYQQSVKVYNYFSTFGKDQSALDTPTTHLKYYGQSFDNLTTILIRWFNIEDIYTFRHLMNGLAGWLCILMAALLAVWLSGYGAGILTLFLFALSPTFLGHAQNNLKDIPFALAYISGTFFLLKWLFTEKREWKDAVLLILSIAFSISIRPGGLLLTCYLLLFVLVKEAITYRESSGLNSVLFKRKMISAGIIFVLSYILGILLWPYLLQNPVTGFWESYKVMTNFPTTIKQIFEGKLEWSDWMPWYYLPKLMLISIPLLVWAGIIGFITVAGKDVRKDWLKYAFLTITILFPILFVIFEKSNLYGSWRHFLFVYPAIVVLAAIGIWHGIIFFQTRIKKGLVITVVLLLSLHPMDFMVRNHPYYYLYYNQLVGGLKGAYGHYETDYYYHSIREGSEWLAGYLKQHHPGDSVKIGANFPAEWFFRNEKMVTVSYVPYSERSRYDWDYDVVANSYIPPVLLKNGNWPPKNSIKIIEADGIPICAVIQRESKADFRGYMAFQQQRMEESLKYFEEAIKINYQDELIFYNFATVCYGMGDKKKALSLLQKGSEINPENEQILMFQANIEAENGNLAKAADFYQRLIRIDRKYFDAYPPLAKILISQNELRKARELLKSCLTMNPGFLAAYAGLADSYRISDPEVARKYDELAK